MPRSIGKGSPPSADRAAKAWRRLGTALDDFVRVFFVSARRPRVRQSQPSRQRAPSPRPRRRKRRPSDKKDDASKPALVASFGDWNVFVGQAGKGRICYTLAQPKSREPAGLNRDPGYAFISDRPTEGVRNEVSFIMGFDVAAGPDSAGSKPEPKTPGKSDIKVRLEIENGGRCRSGRRGRGGDLRAATQGRKPLGQERGARERADRRHAQGREIGGQGVLAQGPRVD